MSDSPSASRLVCLGLGYTAEALARRLAARGFAIVGTVPLAFRHARAGLVDIHVMHRLL